MTAILLKISKSRFRQLLQLLQSMRPSLIIPFSISVASAFSTEFLANMRWVC